MSGARRVKICYLRNSTHSTHQSTCLLLRLYPIVWSSPSGRQGIRFGRRVPAPTLLRLVISLELAYLMGTGASRWRVGRSIARRVTKRRVRE